MKKKVLVSGIAMIATVVIAAIIGVLMFTNVIKCDKSPYLVMFAILSLGAGGYTLGYALYTKSGYALSVGAIVFDTGLICLLIALDVIIGLIITIGVAVFLISFILLLMMYAKPVKDGLKTTDKQDGYVPYMEKLAQEKEIETQSEQELPKIKSFKD